MSLTGRGIAYASPEPFHLLNVAADGMSAFPDRPDDFVRWSGAKPDQFLARAAYGDYLAATLADARGQADAGVSLTVFAGEATGMAADGGVRVLFSKPGVTADELIRQLVRAEPPGRPVIVASTDREVADGVARAGARPVASAMLLKRLS